MNITTKTSIIKEKICENCGLQKSCGDLPGFCLLIYSVPVFLVVVGLSYLLITMNLWALIHNMISAVFMAAVFCYVDQLSHQTNSDS